MKKACNNGGKWVDYSKLTANNRCFRIEFDCSIEDLEEIKESITQYGEIYIIKVWENK